jgi:hypothetical protein
MQATNPHHPCHTHTKKNPPHPEGGPQVRITQRTNRNRKRQETTRLSTRLTRERPTDHTVSSLPPLPFLSSRGLHSLPFPETNATPGLARTPANTNALRYAESRSRAIRVPPSDQTTAANTNTPRSATLSRLATDDSLPKPSPIPPTKQGKKTNRLGVIRKPASQGGLNNQKVAVIERWDGGYGDGDGVW